jgi:predicted dehydrogenase
MTESGKLGAAVVGLGLAGAEHIKAYLANPDCTITALCSRDLDRARNTAHQLGLTHCRVYSDLDALLRQDDVDLVSICTPNNLHVEQGISVAQAGKHLVLEKPIAMDVESARKLDREVSEAGVKNVVCFVLHWYPRFINQRQLAKSGAIGSVFFADCEYLHGHLEQYPSQWRWTWKKEMGGSTLLQGGIHAVDALRQFLPAPAMEVTAYSHGHTAQYEYPPTIVAIVKFADSAIAKITSSFETAMPYQFNLRVYGTKGTIQNGDLWSEVLAPAQSDWARIPAVGADSGNPSHHPFRPLVDHLVDCIRHDRPAFPSIRDALPSHEIVFAADRSAAEGRPVALPL